MDLLETIKEVCFSPKEFFSNDSRTDSRLTDALIYLLVLSIFCAVLYGIINLVFSDYIGSVMGIALTTVQIWAIAISAVPMAFVSVFIGGGVFYLFARLLKGQGSYSESAKALIYAATPAYLLGWIPLLGMLVIFYSFVLEIIGFKEYHEFSYGRSILTVILPVIIIFIFAFLIAFILGMLFAFSPIA